MRRLLLATIVLVAACGDDGPKKSPVDAASIDAPVNNDACADGCVDTGPDSSVDAPPDAAPDAPAIADGIAEVKAAPDGSGLTLPVHHVVVTYLKPQIGSATNDPAGFTVQATATGPGLFVAVDPATLTPVPVVGDTVDFTVTTVATVGGQKRATAIADFTRVSQGANVSALATNISALAAVPADEFDSRLVTVTGTAADAPSSSGGGFQKVTLTTAGISGDPNFQFRVPQTIVDAVDLAATCTITATNVPVGRFNAQVQIGAYRATDFTLTGCPAPVVASAAAQSLTSVRITFSRNVAPASVAGNGSQFTFDNGLTASAATVSGRTVTLTTSVQTINQMYTVTVASSVTDTQGTALGTPNTASFLGFVVPASVRINELNANIGGGCDLIELRVVAAGSMGGWKITERTGSTSANEMAFTFPASFQVQKNDIIVVHTNSGSATCNPGGATAETTLPMAQPKSTYGANYDTAFDFYTDDTGLTATNNVITLFDGAGAIADAILLTDVTTTTIAGGSKTGANTVGAANQWSPAMATYDDAAFLAAAVDDLNATGTAATGTSIQRLDDTDDNDKADWTTGAGAAQTFGTKNANQATL